MPAGGEFIGKVISPHPDIKGEIPNGINMILKRSQHLRSGAEINDIWALQNGHHENRIPGPLIDFSHGGIVCGGAGKRILRKNKPGKNALIRLQSGKQPDGLPGLPHPDKKLRQVHLLLLPGLIKLPEGINRLSFSRGHHVIRNGVLQTQRQRIPAAQISPDNGTGQLGVQRGRVQKSPHAVFHFDVVYHFNF